MHGKLGILAYDSIEDKVQCHICGHWFRGLNAHVRQAHRWSADDYREEFELNRKQGLICEGTKRKIGQINKRLGLSRNLVSQTMTKSELKDFISNIRLIPGYKLRLQTLIPLSDRLKINNPMHNPASLKRRTATLRKTWYGSPRMRQIARENMKSAMVTVRKRNLEQRRYVCSCGEIFPIREDLREHKINMKHKHS